MALTGCRTVVSWGQWCVKPLNHRSGDGDIARYRKSWRTRGTKGSDGHIIVLSQNAVGTDAAQQIERHIIADRIGEIAGHDQVSSSVAPCSAKARR
jgi:hypothetical protein